MKLSQNARDLVLIEIDGLGLLLGEIRYNRQTETIAFILEKAAFFDLYFPCTVIYEKQHGPIVHPHILSTLTTSSLRIQRSRMSCFILGQDLNPVLIEQYNGIKMALAPRPEPGSQAGPPEGDGRADKTKSDEKRVINIKNMKNLKDKV